MKKLFTLILALGLISTATQAQIIRLTAIADAPLGPSIVPVGSLSAFTTIQGSASADKTFTFSASSLTASVVFTAGSGMEISANGSTWAGTATYTQSGGVASGTVHNRIAAATTVGNYSGNVVGSSTGATSVNVPYSATVSAGTGKDSIRVQFDTTSVDQSGWTIMKGDPTTRVITATGGNNSTIVVSSVGTAVANWNGVFNSPPCTTPNNGTTVGTVWNYAPNVMKECWFVYGNSYNSGNPQIKVSGLKTGSTYNLQITASVNTSINFASQGDYRVLGSTLATVQQLDARPSAQENKTASIPFLNITPDGTGAIYIYFNPSAGNSIGALSAFILKEN